MKGYRKSYEDFFAQTQGPIELSYRDMRVVAGRNVAFVHALERIAWTSKSGVKSEMWGRCTSGLEKLHGRWLIVRDHCSVPADFESGKAVMDLKP